MDKQHNEIQVKYGPLFKFLNRMYCKKNGYYVIPSIQRQFIWESRLYENLLNKLTISLKNLKNRSFRSNCKIKKIFLGNILFYHEKQLKTSKDIKIIDGQQRIVTITLILCALRRIVLDIFNGNNFSKVYISNNLETYGNDLNNELENILQKKIKLWKKGKKSYKDICVFLLKWLDVFILREDINYKVEENRARTLLIEMKNQSLTNALINVNEEKSSLEIYMKKVFNSIKGKINEDIESVISQSKQVNSSDVICKKLIYIMKFFFILTKITFVTTKVKKSRLIDSEYSLFINLNARRQKLAPYDIIRGFFMSKLDEFGNETIEVNKFGKKIDEKLFNTIFTIQEPSNEIKVVKEIFHDISFDDENEYFLLSLISEFKELKNNYVKGNLPKTKKCLLSNFFMSFYSYYVPEAFEGKVEDLPFNWVDRLKKDKKEASPSVMEIISSVIQNEPKSKCNLWKWEEDRIDINLKDEKEINNLLNLFRAYIRTFSKEYFFQTFGITNTFYLNILTQGNYLKPIIMRIILSILDNDLKIIPEMIEIAKNVLELLVIYMSINIKRTNDKKLPSEFDKLTPKQGINKYGFWKLDLNQYAINLRKMILELVENKNLKMYLKGFTLSKEAGKHKSIRDRLYRLVLSRHVKHEENYNPNFDLLTFVPIDSKKLDELEATSKLLNIEYLDRTNFRLFQIGNYFYIDKNKMEELDKDDQDDYLKIHRRIFNAFENMLDKPTKPTKIFLNSMEEFFSQMDKNRDFPQEFFKKRTQSLIEDFFIWINNICNKDKIQKKFQSTLVWGEVQSGKTRWICEKLLTISNSIKQNKNHFTLFLVGSTNVLHTQAKDRVIAFFKNRNWNIYEGIEGIKIFKKNNKEVRLIYDSKLSNDKCKSLENNRYSIHYIFLCLKVKNWLDTSSRLIEKLSIKNFTMIDDECDNYSLSNEKIEREDKIINEKIHEILNMNLFECIDKYTISATPLVTDKMNTDLDRIIIMKKREGHRNHFDFLNENMIQTFHIQIHKPKDHGKVSFQKIKQAVKEFIQENKNKPYSQFLINLGDLVEEKENSNSVNEIANRLKDEFGSIIFRLVKDSKSLKEIEKNKGPIVIVSAKKASRGLTFKHLNGVFMDISLNSKKINLSNVLQKARWCGYRNYDSEDDSIKIHISRSAFLQYVIASSFESWWRFSALNKASNKDNEFVLNKEEFGKEWVNKFSKKILSISSKKDLGIYNNLNHNLKTWGVFYNPINVKPNKTNNGLKRKLIDKHRSYLTFKSNALIGIYFPKKFYKNSTNSPELLCIVSDVHKFHSELKQKNSKNNSICIVEFPKFSFNKDKQVFTRSDQNGLLEVRFSI